MLFVLASDCVAVMAVGTTAPTLLNAVCMVGGLLGGLSAQEGGERVVHSKKGKRHKRQPAGVCRVRELVVCRRMNWAKLLIFTSEAWMAPHVSTDACARAAACAPDDGGWGSYLSLISGLLSVMQARTEIGPAFVCVSAFRNQPANKTNGFSLFE